MLPERIAELRILRRKWFNIDVGAIDLAQGLEETLNALEAALARNAELTALLYGVKTHESDEVMAAVWLDKWFRAPADGWEDTLTARSLGGVFAAIREQARKLA